MRLLSDQSDRRTKWYDDFSYISDACASDPGSLSLAPYDWLERVMITAHHDREVSMSARQEVFDTELLEADLILPKNPKGVVLLIHGSGSNRLSPRNQFVAQMLRDGELATLLLDLEMPDERKRREETSVPSVALEEMAKRIIAATEWLKANKNTAGLPVGYLGSGTGAAAALMAAAQRPAMVRGIVSRGGRVELVRTVLSQVSAPALLIVGSRDIPVVHHNREALESIASTEKRLEIVPGARHLFEEPGTLAAAALHAKNWLTRHLPKEPAEAPDRAAVRLL